MSIEVYDYPFKHVLARKISLTKECSKLYKQLIDKTAFTVSDMMISGVEHHNNNVRNIAMSENFSTMLHSYINEIQNIHYPNMPPGKWSIDVCETNISPTAPTLDPHTDDPTEIMKQGYPPPGFLKFLLYVCDIGIIYPNYGTKLYVSDNINDCVKEIEYLCGNLFMWRPGPDTWHGTDFKGIPDKRRFFIGGEYILV